MTNVIMWLNTSENVMLFDKINWLQKKKEEEEEEDLRTGLKPAI